jgi:CheY-like chemotaxis protein
VGAPQRCFAALRRGSSVTRPARGAHTYRRGRRYPNMAVQGAPGALNPQRILIVDDDPLILRALTLLLESDRHTVVTACGGAAGLDAFRHAESAAASFDVVMTDLHMPGMDGQEVTRAVKAICPGTAVVLMTGSIDPSMVAKEAAADIVLTKPPTRNELRTALRILEDRRSLLAAGDNRRAASK